MTELSLVVPTTGEVLDLEDASSCLRVLGEVRDLESRLREVKNILTEALSAEFARQGTKTMEINGVKAVLGGGSEIVWDIEVLEELRGLGLPEERMNDLISTEITHKVNTNVAKQLASVNPAYADVIERAKHTIPKATYVSIRRG